MEYFGYTIRISPIANNTRTANNRYLPAEELELPIIKCRISRTDGRILNSAFTCDCFVYDINCTYKKQTDTYTNRNS